MLEAVLFWWVELHRVFGWVDGSDHGRRSCAPDVTAYGRAAPYAPRLSRVSPGPTQPLRPRAHPVCYPAARMTRLDVGTLIFEL
jgi:hypothetical protein